MQRSTPLKATRELTDTRVTAYYAHRAIHEKGTRRGRHKPAREPPGSNQRRLPSIVETTTTISLTSQRLPRRGEQVAPNVCWMRMATRSTSSVMRTAYVAELPPASTAFLVSCTQERSTREESAPRCDALGTSMTRIELSALPLTRTDAEGLNLSDVTGKSCAWRTVRIGCGCGARCVRIGGSQVRRREREGDARAG